jgi:glycerophosphoryl diester phosphodiesterase
MAKIKFCFFSQINLSWAFLPLFFCSLFAMADPPVAGITAHRGNSGEYPENTLPAFESAIALGLEWAELDIHLTKDGKVIVIHDNNTSRVGDKALEIATSTYEELLTVDVATEFRKAQGKTLQECPFQSIPLLEDVLAVFLKQSETKLSIQPKADIISEAMKIIEKMGAEHIVGFNDGNLAYMSKVKELAPQIPVFWDRPAHSDIDQDIKVAKEKGFEALIINYKGVDREKIQQIKAAGLEVGAWTVNERETIEELLLMGVERIYTDEPRLMMAIRPVPDTVVCEGNYQGHLQGIATDKENNIYWSWTDELVKTDMEGKIIQTVKAPSHQGDLCYKDGKVYVAVNLGKFNQPAGQADSWIFIYDALTLQELQRKAVPEVVHGAGGITFHNGKFIVVGGLVPGLNENYLYEYAEDLTFTQRHTLGSGYTLMGIQTVTYDDGHFWFGCYGNPEVLVQANEDFQVVGKRNFDASLGIAGFSKDQMLIGTNLHLKGKGYIGRAVKVKKTLF